jgi:DNA polymerase-1
MVAPNEVVVIDPTFLLESSEKSFYGAPLFCGPQGEDNTVLYGVTRDLLRLRKSVGIANGIIVIGKEAVSLSSEKNVNKLMQLLRKLGAPVVYEPKAAAVSLCRCLSSAARWVLTQNKGLFQLVSDEFGVIVPDMANSRLEIVTVESLNTSLGIRPAQVPSFLALTEGGKKAIFTKGQAVRVLEVHDNLEKALQHLSTFPSHGMRRLLSANGAVLLARLRDMRLEEVVCPFPALTEPELVFIRDDRINVEILREYGFWSLVRLLPRSVTTGVPVSAKVKPEVQYKAIRNEVEMRELQALISKSEVCAMDTEASGKDPRNASLLGVAFSVNAGEAFYVPVTKVDLDGTSPEVIKAWLSKLFAGRTKFVGHNVKFDYVLLRRHGITIKHVFFDTMLAAYECFGDWEFFNLAAVVKKLIGKDINRYKDIVGDGETLLDLPFSEVVEHGCADADMTLRLYHRLENELEKRNLLVQFSKQAMVLLRALARKECTGVRLNMAAVYRRRAVLTEETATLRSAVIAEAGKEFDIDSLAEITNVLRDIRPLGEQMRGRRLALPQLEELAGTHSLPRRIVKYCRAQKLVRQLDVICREAKEGRVFPIFSQLRSEYGALSSTGPRICEPDGPLEAAAVMDKVVRERMKDQGRSISILQQVTGDEVLKRDVRGWSKHSRLIGGDAVMRNLDQKDLLLATAIGLSDAALCRRFLIDRATVAGKRHALAARYVKVFTWLADYRRDAMNQGFACHDGERKYLAGLKSSDINKRHKALRSAIQWLIRY